MMRPTFLWFLIAVSLCLPAISGKVLNFLDDFGGIPDDESEEACQFNTDLLSGVLQNYAGNNTLLIPENTTFHLFHGVYAKGVNNTVIQIDGTLRFERFDYSWDANDPSACLRIDGSHNVTVTSSGRGLIDGRGPQWWGIPLIGFLEVKENRPRLVVFNQTKDLLIENIILQDSPYHTLYLEAVNRAEVRHISVVARRTEREGHSWIDLTAFNTDGIDVSGHNVHIHDVDIWTQDDCIAVKDRYGPSF
jgi:polygalacturonase